MTEERDAPASVAPAIGIDLVELSEIDGSVREFGARYLERIYTPKELAYCTSAALWFTPHLAARFAAKEATLKVLKPLPEDEGIDWRALEVERRADGSCRMKLRGAALRLAERRGLSSFEVSLTHTEHYAAAVVLGTGPSTSTQGLHLKDIIES
jgi:holo-[acyl-carrier protein] synthase